MKDGLVTMMGYILDLWHMVRLPSKNKVFTRMELHKGEFDYY